MTARAKARDATTAPVVTLRALNRATLARQMLLSRHDLTAIDATGHLVALQAQLPRPPFIGLWSRIRNAPREAVVAALLDRRIVRGTSLRGTLHVMTAPDFQQFRAAIQPALDRGVRMVGARVDPGDVDRALDLARSFFAEPRPFDALRDYLDERFPGRNIRALAYTIRMTLPLIQVPTESAWGFPAHASFLTADAWLGPLPSGASTAEDLVIRYLTAYGPAAVADIQAWSGLSALGAVLDGMRPRLVTLRAEGRPKTELFDVPDAPRPPADIPAPVRFLPEYDNAIVGRTDARLLAGEHRSSVFVSGLRVLPTVLVDGFVAGTWAIERRKTSATLVVTPFTLLPKSSALDLHREGGALLRFTEPAAAVLSVRVESI